MAEPAQDPSTQVTVNELVAVLGRLQETDAGEMPVAVNVGNRLVLPVLQLALQLYVSVLLRRMCFRSLLL